jgi:endoglucanase
MKRSVLRGLAVAGAAVLALTAGGVGASVTASAAPGCGLDYAVTGTWPGGLQAAVTVTNTGSAEIRSWTAGFTLPSGQVVTNLWNGAHSQSGQQVTVRNAAHNGTLAAGASTSFGFTASSTGDHGTATGLVLNGVPCDGSAPPPTTPPPTTTPPPGPAGPADDDWLHVEDNRIVDRNGDPVWLTGANWFGFNTSERVFHGLWSSNLEASIREMARRGINLLRVPISSQLLLEWKNGQATVSSAVNTHENPALAGRTTLEVWDATVAAAKANGMKIMLDVHSAEADNSGHIYPVWWKGAITPELFYQAWEWIVDRHAGDDTVIAADVKNEPHGKANESPRAKWDSSTDQDNFKNACEVAGRRILAINPDLLILCEGIEIYPKDGVTWSSTNGLDYHANWWGGNLRGVAQHPVDLGPNQDQLVYSPHDYGPLVYEQPWFQGEFDKASLTADVWDPNWLYIHKQGIAPLLVGEWGGRIGQDPRQDEWLLALRDTIVEHRLHQTFWAYNDNSGDTGGLVTGDWKTWDEVKYNLLRPALWADGGGRFVSLDHVVTLPGGTNVTQYYAGGNAPPVDLGDRVPAVR